MVATYFTGLLVNENEKIGVVAGWARDTGTDGIDEIKKALYIHRATSAGIFFHCMSIVKQQVDEQGVS